MSTHCCKIVVACTQQASSSSGLNQPIDNEVVATFCFGQPAVVQQLTQGEARTITLEAASQAGAVLLSEIWNPNGVIHWIFLDCHDQPES